MNNAYYNSPFGFMKITEENGFIVELIFTDENHSPSDKEGVSQVLADTINQLDEYFSGKRMEFSLPVKQDGTPFQKKAWEYLQTIPYGETVSYKQEAEAIGSPDAVRAVGSANGANNIVIIIPCHRVINYNGKLGGYAYGLPIKEKLLKMEKEYLKQFWG